MLDVYCRKAKTKPFSAWAKTSQSSFHFYFDLSLLHPASQLSTINDPTNSRRRSPVSPPPLISGAVPSRNSHQVRE
ncbi:hypothetical protein L1887_38558 [Cichorium endivia]|nr:hypothetical protein L1887_38558 [Cichorium endivia]